MSYISILLIRFYQRLISPLLSGSCRFYPTCSQFSIEAFQVHGFLVGLYLSIKRILRCNPFCQCGYDPVPPKKVCSHNLRIVNKLQDQING